MSTSKLQILSIMVALSVAISCSPSRYMIDVEMRHNSKAGIDLTGKNISVIYGSCEDYTSSEFVASMADGFAWNLDNDSQYAVDSVGVFALAESAEKYASRDSLISLLIESGSDVVFLFDKVGLGEVSKSGTSVSLPFTVSLKCYDAMNSKDEMLSFGGNSTARVASLEELPSSAWDAGKTISASFLPQWKREQYSIYYLENEKWLSALLLAENYRWKDAMTIWFELLDSKDPLKRSCACYNIATSCYMLGDYTLASEWLDRSDKENPLPLSSALRKRINARK